MNLTIKVRASNYGDIQSGLLAEAQRFYGDRRFGFYDLTVKVDGDSYEAEATAYEVTAPRRRTTKVDVPDEAWDPFANTNGYDPF